MKKQLLVLSVFGLILLSACKEVGSPISFAVGGFDNTFVTTTETPEPRRILIEDATGVQCPNCPAGATLLKEAESQNPGRVIVVGLHAKSLTAPIAGKSVQDFRTTFAADLFTFFKGEPHKPAAVFDRTLQGADNKFFIESRTLWKNIITQRLSVPTPVNIAATSDLNEATREATIKIRISYTQTVSKNQALAVMITEDSIIDAQIDGLVYIHDYEHNHVLRDMLTPISGFTIPTEGGVLKTAGRVYEKTFTYALPAHSDKWNVNKCNVIAFVHNAEGEDTEVAQAVEVHLKHQ